MSWTNGLLIVIARLVPSGADIAPTPLCEIPVCQQSQTRGLSSVTPSQFDPNCQPRPSQPNTDTSRARKLTQLVPLIPGPWASFTVMPRSLTPVDVFPSP